MRTLKLALGLGAAVGRSRESADYDLISIHIDTKEVTQLTSGASSERHPVWAPGGRILFTSNLTGRTGLWSLRVQDGKGVGEPELLKPDIGNVSLQGVTRDGTLVYTLTDLVQDL